LTGWNLAGVMRDRKPATNESSGKLAAGAIF